MLFSSIVLALCLVFPSAVAGQAPSYFAPANILKFADFLFDEQDYLRAAAEYERYLSAAELPDSQAATIRFKIAQCFRFSHDYERAVSVFHVVTENARGTDVAANARVQIAYSLFLAGKYQESDRVVTRSLPLETRRGVRQTLANLRVVNLFSERRWKEAGDYLRSAGDGISDDSVNTELQALVEEGASLRRKSGAIAGLLSAIVPGAGRIYVGRKVDGILSLLTLAATAWQAHQAFGRDGGESVKGWIYGALGGALYVGNVYGSVVAARISNADAENRLIERARVSISVSFR